MKFSKLLILSILLLAILTIGAVSASDNMTDDVVSADDEVEDTLNEDAFSSEEELSEPSEIDVRFAYTDDTVAENQSLVLVATINNAKMDVSVDGNPANWNYTYADEVDQQFIVYTEGLSLGKHILNVKLTNDSYFNDVDKNLPFFITNVVVRIPETVVVNDIIHDGMIVDLPCGDPGNLLVEIDDETYNYTSNGTQSFSLANLSTVNNPHIIKVIYENGEGNVTYNKTFSVNATYYFNMRNDTFTYGHWPFDYDFEVPIGLPADKLSVKIEGKSYNFTEIYEEHYGVDISQLYLGTYEITVSYPGDDKFAPHSESATFTVRPHVDVSVPKTVTNGKGSISASLPFNDEGTMMAEIYNTKDSYSFSKKMVNGKASIPLNGLNAGTYHVVLTYNDRIGGYSHCGNYTITVKNSKLTAKALTKYYGSSSAFKVKVQNYKGKIVKYGKVKFYINGKYVKTVKTSKKGYATLKVAKAPGSYKITAKYGNVKITRNLKVNHAVTLNTVTVKKSAKKLVLKATVKVGKKPLKYKKVTFKFNGKTYKVKTNKKGIAKVTIKKTVLKTLEVGKTVKYQATYLKDTVKKSAEVKE